MEYDDISEIRKQIDIGNYDIALEKIGKMPDSLNLEVLILKSKTFRFNGNYDQALDIIDKVIVTIQQNNNSTSELMLDALFERSATFLKHSPEKWTENIEQIEFILKALQASNLHDKLQTQTAKLYMAKGRYIKYYQHNIEESLQYFQRSLTIFKEIGENYKTANLYNFIGYTYFDLLDHQKALAYLKKALYYYEQFGKTEAIGEPYLLIGQIYSNQGQYDLALEYFHKKLELDKTYPSQSKLKLHSYNKFTLTGIGQILYNQGNMNKAQKILEKALVESINERAIVEQRRKTYSDYLMIWSKIYENRILFLLIKIELEHHHKPDVKQLIDRMEERMDYIKEKVQKTENIEDLLKKLEILIKLAKALVLKSNSRIRIKMRAQDILLNLVESPFAFLTNKIIAIQSLCDLLLDELKLYGEPKVLEETTSLVQKLHNIAEEQHIYPLMVDVLILKSKLALIAGDVSLASKLIDQADQISIEKHLTGIRERILLEKQDLEANLNSWKELVDNNASLYDRINKTKIQNYLQKAQTYISELPLPK